MNGQTVMETDWRMCRDSAAYRRARGGMEIQAHAEVVEILEREAPSDKWGTFEKRHGVWGKIYATIGEPQWIPITEFGKIPAPNAEPA